MKQWMVDFPIGRVDWAVHCQGCAREVIVRRVSSMSKVFGSPIKHCVFCGSVDIISEQVSA